MSKHKQHTQRIEAVRDSEKSTDKPEVATEQVLASEVLSEQPQVIDESTPDMVNEEDSNPPKSLETQRETLQRELTEIKQTEETLARRKREVRQQIDRLTSQIQKAVPEQTPTDHIQQYINKQNILRQQRFARQQEIVEAGHEHADPRAPIDAAMGQSKKRGTARPTYPVRPING